MQNLQQELIQLLEQVDNFTIDGQLNKTIIVEAALKLDPSLLRILIKSETFKKHFFKDIEGVLVFDKIEFQRFVNNKSFLPDSYTAFKNKIGLTINDESLDNFITSRNDVVLAWPHKDCVLEGGQTKEDQKRNEIFWNETLAPDNVDRLLSPKAFTNFKRYEAVKSTKKEKSEGLGLETESEGLEIKETELNGKEEIDFSKENLIIKGNNLLALASLLKTHRGKIKLIYIDPPYNTGSDSFGYNDKFNHSAWLTFMKNRLSIAKQLLSIDGSIWVNIDDDESHYLKVLMDDLFGRDNFISNVIWKKKYSPQNDAKYFSDMHDHIIVYAKFKDSLEINLLPRTEEANKRYKNPDNDKRGPWKSSDFSVKTYSKDYDYPITTPSGRVVNPPRSRSWRTSQDKFKELLKEDRIYFGLNDDAVPSIKRFLSEVQQGTPPQSIWDYGEVGHNQDARKEILALLDTSDFSTPKPEKLLQRIIHIGTKEGDTVLDFFAGSGTTAAVAHKMGRKFITTEQMDYIEDVTKERLKKVLQGEQGGISKDVNWKGGGSFTYLELMPFNQSYIDKIQSAKTKDELISIWKEMKEGASLSYLFDSDLFDERLEAFKTAAIEDMKSYLVEILDKNQLYVNYSEIEDDDYQVSPEDIALNHQFYKKK